MLWKTHVCAGLNTLWLFHLVPHSAPLISFPALAACGAFGSCLPDLDAANSKIRSLKIGGVQPFRAVGAVAHWAFGHRGLMHSPLALLGLAFGLRQLLCPWVGPACCAALWLGYGSHLLLDAITPSGIPLGFGNKPRLRLLPKKLCIPTGSFGEKTFLTLLLLACMTLAVSLRHPKETPLGSMQRLWKVAETGVRILWQ